ncbi:hypothetical protein KUG47_02870 [Falsochrobactrum sp. TDYN1]|uniref:Uncharacterized protein n=1 Tax=Falsochrobactrum tianjinense TaxID=2706015 RepID=A0A949UTU4_9HYPH|nr:hypothetical protein [Falsochrobactrum sp. TDYN1]MBV2142438.1 hypothetical protein [Falsochrobactrum sp. TDYN1]
MSGKIAPLIGALAVISLLGTGFGASSVDAQEAGRYRLEKTETGYVRLDTRTGALSVCNEQQAQLVCKMATEDREAYENDISGLQVRVKKLEDKVAALEKSGSPAASTLPTEDEFEKSMSYMERFMRRFMDIARSFDRETEKPEPDTAPGRT